MSTQDMAERTRAVDDVVRARFADRSQSEQGHVRYMLTVDALHAASGRTARTGAAFTSYEALVLRYGRFWTPAPLPKGIERGPQRKCYSNALDLAMTDPDLIYVEGYATRFITCEHAWCVTPNAQVIDPTWDDPQDATYYGIPFDIEFAVRVTDANGFYGLLCNDWRHREGNPPHRMLHAGLQVAADGPIEGMVCGYGDA